VKLYLIRHAKSSWDDPLLPDHDRPLSLRGQRNAPFMATRTANLYPAPQLLVSSTAVRARSTAEWFAQRWQLPESQLIPDKRLYLATPNELLNLLLEYRSRLPTAEALAMVGHNEGLTQFANALCAEPFTDNIPTGGVAVLQLPADFRANKAWATATLLNFDYPRLHFPKNPRNPD
jgi:phosphohistidine phosphatase